MTTTPAQPEPSRTHAAGDCIAAGIQPVCEECLERLPSVSYERAAPALVDAEPSIAETAVPWETFCIFISDRSPKFTDEWLLNPANVVSHFRNSRYCRLCDSFFFGSPESHVAGHAPSLAAWRAEQHSRGTKMRSEKLEAARRDQAEKRLAQVRCARELRNRGQTIPEIAADLGIAENIVRSHLEEVLASEPDRDDGHEQAVESAEVLGVGSGTGEQVGGVP